MYLLYFFAIHYAVFVILRGIYPHIVYIVFFCPRKLYVLLSFVSEECLIENDIRSYSYLTNGYVPVITGDDDVELYRQVLEAMDVLGFTKDEQIG